MTVSIQQVHHCFERNIYKRHSCIDCAFFFSSFLQEHWEPPCDHKECRRMLRQAQLCKFSRTCPSPAHIVLQSSWKPGHLFDQPTGHTLDFARPKVRAYILLCLPFILYVYCFDHPSSWQTHNCVGLNCLLRSS